MVGYMGMQEAKFTPGEWSTSHYEAMEYDGTGTLVPAGYMKRNVKAVRYDEQGRRCTQFLAEVHEQAAHPEQGAANAGLMVAAPKLLAECVNAVSMLSSLVNMAELGNDMRGYLQEKSEKIRQFINEAQAVIDKATSSVENND
jgi:hypothetical protein